MFIGNGEAHLCRGWQRSGWSRATIVVLASAVIPLVAVGAPPVACPAGEPPSDLAAAFAAYEVDGTLVVADTAGFVCARVNSARASTRFQPASTFKVFNTMVALDAGAIPNEHTVLEWDGVDRGSAGWNQSQDMATAFRRSTLWFYQEMARRTGESRMREWLERESYGDADTSGGIDRFWLDGGLGISADEQVDFLRRLYTRRLGFSRRAQDIAHNLLRMETADSYTLYGKTGWTVVGGKQIGWLIGYVEAGESVYLFAMNLESTDPNFPMREARERIVRTLLARLGILPATGD